MENVESFREYCIRKPFVSESFPFGEDTLVFKVGSKMFSLLNLSNPASANLKCNPERAIELREEYESITPGYHMNKQHWNTIQIDGTLPNELIMELIDHSYKLVYQSLTMKEKANLKNED